VLVAVKVPVPFPLFVKKKSSVPSENVPNVTLVAVRWLALSAAIETKATILNGMIEWYLELERGRIDH
jgi:hypothetical protein